jgi:hypothetical protein
MRSLQQPDLSHFREPETVGVGDTATDVLAGITIMLFVIAVEFWCAGVIGS